jgi:hypothetical protein
MNYECNAYKPYYQQIKRDFCSVCGKTISIADDDLEDIYSHSDFCLCHLKRFMTDLAMGNNHLSSESYRMGELEVPPHRQAELEESRGKLLRVIESEGQFIAFYDFGAVSLPLEMAEDLTKLVGHKIAVLRLSGQFRVQDLGAEDA